MQGPEDIKFSFSQVDRVHHGRAEKSRQEAWRRKGPEIFFPLCSRGRGQRKRDIGTE